ncbi:DNA-binding transcriptional regulator, MarR family [Amycolatopsis pretoriensis]|uniref:DNA-binding transcriptional regulator, MarR family n=1 Tax=Amycolatopsis pretoriensis TaxID=218821 RepID=A0A1H5Q2A8_9PSEU|nr:MarR family transcriptional regulator [Amycolatopsis pretoriensis]SEF20054.1 DNA-binding transcriptional regulator, MarR family [Amycolatopsis pretoriensis]
MSQPVPAPEAAGPGLLYLVKQLELAVRARLDEVLRPVALTPLQYTALTVLERRSGLATAELARNSFVTDQAMADMVVALERRGLIVREGDPRDRRRRVIGLTGPGQELLDRVRDDVTALEERMVSQLNPRDAARFRAYVVACHAALADRPSR